MITAGNRQFQKGAPTHQLSKPRDKTWGHQTCSLKTRTTKTKWGLYSLASMMLPFENRLQKPPIWELNFLFLISLVISQIKETISLIEWGTLLLVVLLRFITLRRKDPTLQCPKKTSKFLVNRQERVRCRELSYRRVHILKLSRKKKKLMLC
jgi:hypothetical protein